MSLVLSEKYIDFLNYDDAEFEVLEGTTASGKTTVGGCVKFITKVLKNEKKMHIIAGQDIGTIEKNIITCDLGIKDIWGDYVQFYPKGKGAIGLPHLSIKYKGIERIILLLGYDNQSRWKKALGGQYGCVYIDEINTADMAFVRQIMMRCDYGMATLNPDDPDKEIYKEYINRCRPIEKYKNDGPKELLEMLNEPAEDKWVWWYFSFDHNLGLSKEKIEKIKRTHKPGSSDYLHYIVGMRGRAEGIIFDNFDEKLHCLTKQASIELVKKSSRQEEYFTLFTAGLDTAYSTNSEDTVAMSFLGITNKNNIYLLDEEIYNGKDSKEFFSPSQIVEKYVNFLNKNKDIYGFCKDCFIDSADQATISEFRKYKNKTGSIYNFNPAYKGIKIIDRIQLQKGWFATGNFYVVQDCKYYIKELHTYSWNPNNKVEPEDANDHMINSVQYAWIPYKNKIGLQGR